MGRTAAVVVAVAALWIEGVCAASLRHAAASAADGPTVTTAQGTVRGLTSNGVNSFRALPYAAPPVGELRWEDPTPPASWSGVRDATTWSDGCPQICDLPPGTCPPQWSEDCLYLNVFTPATATADSNLPVLFWIPGGRYLQGAAGMSLYDGSVLAKEQNVVVVTTNYRLGVLGFAYVDGRANWGIRDQIQALQWVQNNIKAFGGDPSSVTLSGQSAGGTSVATLLVSPLAKGLYSRAIMESDPAALRLKQASEASTTAQKMAEALGCAQDDLVCLRAASVDDIMQAQGQANKHFFLSYPLDLFYPETPFVGDDVLAAEPLEAILGGSSWNHVPLMVGNVKDEGIMFVDSAVDRLSQLEFRALVTYIFGLSRESKLEDLYPTGSVFHKNDTRPALSDLATDYIFRCPARAIAQSWAAAGLDVYNYQFNHAPSSGATWGANFSFCAGSVCHGSEIPFVFGSFNAFPGATTTPAEDALGTQVRDYWGAFIKGSAPWPEWTARPGSADSGKVMLLDVAGEGGVTTGLHAEACDWWDQQGYQFW